MPAENVIFNADWYRTFITATNEKDLLVDTIAKLIGDATNQTCLDVGLGINPFFAEKLANMFERYVIVERQLADVAVPDNTKLVNADWEKVELDELFDVIIASHVYYYFDDKQRAVAKMFDHLKPQGRVYFVVNGKEPDYGPLKLAFSRMIGKPYIFTYDEIQRTLGDRKWKEYSVTSFLSFESPEALYEAMRISFDKYPDQYKQYRDEIISYLAKNVSGGKFGIEQKVLEVRKEAA